MTCAILTALHRHPYLATLAAILVAAILETPS